MEQGLTILGWTAAIATRELALAAAILIAAIGIDDLLVDLLYASRRLWRRLTIYRRVERATADTLPPAAHPGRFAILVPAWQEAGVIGGMLRSTLSRLGDGDYQIFVGLYPNDRVTMAEVAAVGDPRILPVINRRDGGTTKADNLNTIWQALRFEEQRTGVRFKGIVLHDAEDIVHSAELKLFDRLLERFDLVQLPVLPLPDPASPWVAGHYLDEFAESHGKDLVVREAMGAAMPSAGVGCAIHRDMLDRIAQLNGGLPFDEAALTEDYELGLKIGQLGGRGVLVRMPCGGGRVVATREHFPATLGAAVRQKARWLTGIALAGWDRLGWHGNLAEHWWRLRDRRAVPAALATMLAYLAAVGALVTLAMGWLRPDITLPPIAEPGSLLATLLALNVGLLVWRLGLRALFTARAYGPAQGLLAIPRAVIANLIAILACLHALGQFAVGWRHGRRLPWVKTTHAFPAVLPSE